MKISRLYTISLRNVERLAKVTNKSALVNRALEKYFNEKEQFGMADVETGTLLNVLLTRGDISVALRKIIEVELWE